MARVEVKDEGAFTKRNKKAVNDNFTELYASGSGDVVGPSSVTSGKVAVFSGTTGKLIAANSSGATAGPFTTITAIQVVNGLVTSLTGS